MENNSRAGEASELGERCLLLSIACSKKLILTMTFAFSFVNVEGCCSNLHFNCFKPVFLREQGAFNHA